MWAGKNSFSTYVCYTLDVLFRCQLYLLISKSIKLSIFSVSVAEVNATTYFKTPFLTLAFPKQLVEYIVMNIEPIAEHERHKFSGQGAISKRVSSNLSTYFLFIFFNRKTVTKDWTLAHDWWQLCAQDQGKIKARWLGRKKMQNISFLDAVTLLKNRCYTIFRNAFLFLFLSLKCLSSI